MQAYDKRTLDQIQRTLAADGYHFQTLIREVVASPAFQSRRGEQVVPTTAIVEKSKEAAPK